MLVLNRKPGEQVAIGANIVVTITEVSGGRVRIAIEAPKSVTIVRGELADDPEIAAFRSQWTAVDREKAPATSLEANSDVVPHNP